MFGRVTVRGLFGWVIVLGFVWLDYNVRDSFAVLGFVWLGDIGVGLAR